MGPNQSADRRVRVGRDSQELEVTPSTFTTITTAPTSTMAQQGTGFLCVFAEPGSQVTLDEFQGTFYPPNPIDVCSLEHVVDWYNNEHVPLRLNHLPSFLTGARYSSSDNQIPSWVALYDIDDPKTFSDESYTRLRANRSPREAALVTRLEILDRRTCRLVSDSGVPAEEVSTSLAFKNPSKVLVTHGFESLGADANGAYEEVKKLSGKGWIRSRIFECYDNLTTGVGKDLKQEVPKYLVVHGKLSQ